jgi:propanediol dehydratase small subunit
MAAELPLPLTLEEHRDLGREIRRTTARFLELRALVTTVYGRNSLAAFNFEKAVETLERLQEDMEAQAAQDLAGVGAEGLYR